MRMWITCAVLCMSFAALSPSQASAEYPGWNAILRGGWANGGVYQGGELTGGNDRNGLVAEGAFEYEMNRDYSWEFALKYVQKGASGRAEPEYLGSASPPTDEIEGTAELDYVEIATTLVAGLTPTPETEVRLYLGLGIGTMVNGKFDGTVNGSPTEFDLKDRLNTFDFLGLLGAGFAFDVKAVRILLDLRSEFAFTNLNKDSNQEPIRTRSYQVTAGVALPLTH